MNRTADQDRVRDGAVITFLAAVIMAGVGILLRKLADKQAVRVWRKKNLM